jgi:hypothetical protein
LSDMLPVKSSLILLVTIWQLNKMNRQVGILPKNNWSFHFKLHSH